LILAVVVAVFLATPPAMILCATRDPVSRSKWNQIQPGMTKAEVFEIMGKPDSYEGTQLEYSNALNAGWVEFQFDKEDVLVWKNDESVFGSLRDD